MIEKSNLVGYEITKGGAKDVCLEGGDWRTCLEGLSVSTKVVLKTFIFHGD